MLRKYNAFSFTVTSSYKPFLVADGSNKNVLNQGPVSAGQLVFVFNMAGRIVRTSFYLTRGMTAVLVEMKVVVAAGFRWNSWIIREFQRIYGLLKTNYTSVAGYAMIYKKRFYLSGQVNRFERLKKRRVMLQIGFTHRVRVRTLKMFRFRKWRRKRFGIRVRSNNFNHFTAFIDLFRHLRFRAKYTSRGIRIKKDRFKMKFRPDHGKYGFKMNY